MPSDSMDDIELKNIQLHLPTARCLGGGGAPVPEERVQTDRGQLLVAVQGSRSKPAIITYHDLGLNCEWSSYAHLRSFHSKIAETITFRLFFEIFSSIFNWVNSRVSITCTNHYRCNTVLDKILIIQINSFSTDIFRKFQYIEYNVYERLIARIFQYSLEARGKREIAKTQVYIFLQPWSFR